MSTWVESIADVAKLLKQYDRGAYTEHEVVAHLIQAAAMCSPFQLASALPAMWLNVLRQRTEVLPANANAAPRIYAATTSVAASANEEVYFGSEKVVWYKGACEWHKYFA